MTPDRRCRRVRRSDTGVEDLQTVVTAGVGVHWEPLSGSPLDKWTAQTVFRKWMVAYDLAVYFTVLLQFSVETCMTPFPKLLWKLEFSVQA